METCIFCSIANNDADKWVWHNDTFVAFKNIAPQAPVHLLVVPKQHIENLDHLEDAKLAGELILAAREVAHAMGLKGGWRVQINNGKHAGQTVFHLHVHVLGGKEMAE